MEEVFLREGEEGDRGGEEVKGRETRAILLLSALWLAAGFAAGWTAGVIRGEREAPGPLANPMVKRLEEVLGLDARQKEMLSAALEGNRRKIERVKMDESSLNPSARKKIARIRAELDYIIQYGILTEEQLAKYWALRKQGPGGRKR